MRYRHRHRHRHRQMRLRWIYSLFSKFLQVWGTLLARKTYKVKDYVVAGGVTFGTTVFLLTGEVTAKHAKTSSRATSETSFLGLFIMTAYLFFDGCKHIHTQKHARNAHTHAHARARTHTHKYTSNHPHVYIFSTRPQIIQYNIYH
jgi:glycerol uptake facilitator-like aquaporin